MKYGLLVLLLFFSLGPGLALAGLVEDAEEELKKLKQQQAESGQVVRQMPPQQSFPEVVPSTSTQSSVETSKPRVQSQSSPDRRGVKATGTTSKSEPKRVKRVRKREASDRLLSVLGILLFLVLIVAGALYGKRSDAEI